ncbi:MAG: alpha-E domain-containing protein [Cytophagales bacterium]|nr:alpha-E domain-containing protein [Cytophagales bacterium]
MGRYIERAEHLARYTKVQYISSLDAPIAQKMEFVLESILDFSGVIEDYEKKNPRLIEEDVMQYMILNEENPFSICSSVSYARENARGARDTISSELWESLNKYYHFVNETNEKHLGATGPYEFSEKILEYSSVVKGYIDNTLIQNEVWDFINLGIHLERSIQIARIIVAKTNDIEKLKKLKSDETVINYQWGILLKSAESFDMSRKFYKALPNKTNTLEFMILNPSFPKSINFNLSKAYFILHHLSKSAIEDQGSLEFKVGKLSSTYKYLTVSEVESKLNVFLNETVNNIYELANAIEEKYLN